MKKEELLKVVGGAGISGALITALYKAGSTIFQLGQAFGTAIRRMVTNSSCPV